MRCFWRAYCKEKLMSIKSVVFFGWIICLAIIASPAYAENDLQAMLRRIQEYSAAGNYPAIH
jgi:hypothetical protein